MIFPVYILPFSHATFSNHYYYHKPLYIPEYLFTTAVSKVNLLSLPSGIKMAILYRFQEKFVKTVILVQHGIHRNINIAWCKVLKLSNLPLLFLSRNKVISGTALKFQ